VLIRSPAASRSEQWLAVGDRLRTTLGQRSGHLPALAEITEVHRHIHTCLLAHLGTEAREARILCGGSVNRANAAGILQLPEVGGALVGGASLTAMDFQLAFTAVPSELRSSVQQADSCPRSAFRLGCPFHRPHKVLLAERLLKYRPIQDAGPSDGAAHDDMRHWSRAQNRLHR
jgi:hypothetical protein